MIPTISQRKPESDRMLTNLRPVEEALKTYSTKCETVAARLLTVGAGRVGVQNFTSELTTLRERIVSVTQLMAQCRQSGFVDGSGCADLSALFSKTVIGVQTLKEKNATLPLFDKEDSSLVDKLLEELARILSTGAEIVSADNDSDQSLHFAFLEEVIKLPCADLRALLRLVQLLQHSDEVVATKASDALRKVKIENTQTMIEFAKVLEPLLQHEKEKIREVASEVLSRINPTYPGLEETLVSLLQSSDKALFSRVANILGRMDVVRPLIPFLEGPDWRLVWAGISQSLYRRRGPHYVEDLKAVALLLKNPNVQVGYIVEFMFSLVKPLEKEVTEIIISCLTNEIAHIRRNAIVILEKIAPCDHEAYASLPPLLQDPDPTVRLAACKVLIRIGRTEAVRLDVEKALILLLENPDKEIKEGAAKQMKSYSKSCG